jgi:hypothetical protein
MSRQVLHLPLGFQSLPGGVLLFTQPAEATPASINQFFDNVRRISNPTARLLVDARGWKTVDAAGVVYQRGVEVRRMRIAVVTATRLQRAMVTFAALAARTHVRCFETIEEAQRWLNA